MPNIALITAKGGNLTLENKNVREICGKPSLYWPVSAAKKAEMIHEVFVTTECGEIKRASEEYGARAIERPAELARPDSNHGDAILHGAKAAAKILGTEIKTVTILLGNTVMITSEDIDEVVGKTLSDENIDSCMTVWKAQDDHPLRAMVIDGEGFLKPYLEGVKPDTNRQSYEEVYFYDQGPWTVRMKSLLRSETTREGPGAWWWMGKNCVPIQRLWVTGRDIHSQYDVDVAKWWLEKYRLAGVRNPRRTEDYKKAAREETDMKKR